eukprot:jgi/Psemu1/15516/gm1.15516_g
MKGWMNIPADNKKKLVACLRPDLLPKRPPDPNSIKPISRRAYEHSVVHDQDSSMVEPPDETTVRNAIHASLGLYKAESQPDDRPLKSSVSPAHPARFLADNPNVLYKKDGDTYIPVAGSSLSANFHKWSVHDDLSLPSPSGSLTRVYHSNKTSVSKPGYAMVDRGANGCIIGNNACLISKDIPPRYVNVTGINNCYSKNRPKG